MSVPPYARSSHSAGGVAQALLDDDDEEEEEAGRHFQAHLQGLQ